MIQYDTQKWGDTFLKIIISFWWANNYRRLLAFIMLAATYTSIIIYVNKEVWNMGVHLDPVFFSLIGLILSLILVFRLNTAYDKWWEGRKNWGKLVNNCRTFSAYMHAVLTKDDTPNRKFFAAQIGNFCYALKGHLREGVEFSDFDDYKHDTQAEINKEGHIPHEISGLMFTRIHELVKEEKITEIDKLALKTQVENLLDILGVCERIKNTPIPWSHSSFIKLFVAFYLTALPFGLMDSFGYFAVPIAALMSFALAGVEIISEEIEEPFKTDPNDLPLTHLSGVIRTNVYTLLNVPFPPQHPIPDVSHAGRFKVTF